MKKRLFSCLLAFLLSFYLLPTASFAAGSFSNFSKVKTYQPGQFTDISNEWFAPSVQAAYEYGLFNGKTTTTFEPQSRLTLAEAIKLAACIHSIYNNGSCEFPGSDVWYQPYVDYALANNIIKSSYSNYDSFATRSDFALIFSNALPDEACAEINSIPNNSIPDVPSSYSYAPAVYKLYRAGIITGSDNAGTFYPNSNITRDACAAIAIRMINPSFRQSLTIKPKALTAKEISDKYSPAVFYIELYNASGKAFASGSGFFLSSDGLAATNYHVIEGAASAKIITRDGKTYPVSGVYDYNKTTDLALIKIGGCSDVPYLLFGDSNNVETGDTIYAIGYPLGVDQTVTQGTVTNASHIIDGVDHIMFSASISTGSSGGALLNDSGKVIGVTSATYKNGQNLNLAMPINLVKDLSVASISPLESSTPSKTIPTLTVSSPTVKLTQGSQATITFTASSMDFSSASYDIVDTSVMSCNFGRWNGNSVTATIKGLSKGTSTITLFLLDKDGNAIASAYVNVTVTNNSENSSTVYYKGYYPVPDWGAYTNSPLYYEHYSNGVALYYYRISDFKGGTTTAENYLKLLESCGFTYVSSNKYDGYTQLFYKSTQWFVSTGLINLNGTVCMCISIQPFKY